LRHAPIKIEDALLRRLILLMDGARDQPTLLRELTTSVQSDEGRLDRNGRVMTDHAEIAETLSREFPLALTGVARLAILMR
jgi:hypothetical protein